MHFAIAAAAVNLGLVDEARKATNRMLQLTPELADPDKLREFTERWFWKEEMVGALVDGVQRAFDDRSTKSSTDVRQPSDRGTDAERSSHDRRTSVERPSNVHPNDLSISVLPLVARSSDEESKALAEGLADDIVAGLSRFGHIRVQSRSTSRSHARYSLEGYVRKAGPSIRVGVTVVDADTGANLWAEQFDRNAAMAAFELQDDVASRIIAAVGDPTGVLARSMAAAIAGKPIEQLSVAELVVRYHAYTENFRADEHALLREAFERALEHEPRNAEGWGCLALLYHQEHGFGFNCLPGTLHRQRQAAERAIESDPHCQQAWMALLSVHVFSRDIEGLKTAAERAVSINPLNADQLALAGNFLSMAGEHERAHELVLTAIARKPQHPGWYHFPMCNYQMVHGNYEAALREVKSVNMPKMPFMHLAAAAISGHLGRAREAKAAFEGLANINPALTEPLNARAAWAVWIKSEATLNNLEEGFLKARNLAGLTSPASRPPESAASIAQSIAVLPFVDLSETKDQDWFCDGIAEELLNALAPLPGLRVAARASAFSFRGKTDDLRSIGEKLNVTTVLEGSVRRLGDRVRITTRLSDTKEGRQLWSERFDRELRDIFDVQEEIARAIAERLRITNAGGSARLVQQATTNMEAYELLLKGRAFVTRRGRAVLEAIPLFERAIALDPNLAEAHGLLGDAYRLLVLYGIASASEAMPKARASIARALAIDPNQPEALASRAISASIYEWDIDELLKRSARAIAADPSHVRARAERAIGLACLHTSGTSWHAEVLAEVERARTLDPLNAWVAAIQGFVQYLVGHSDEGIENARRAIELDPGNFTAHWVHVSALAHAGRDDEALAAAEPALAMSGRHPMILTTIAAIYFDRGEQQKAEAIRGELAERAASTFVGSAARACAAASAGHWAEAREFATIAADEHDPFMAFWKLRAWRPAWKDEQCAAIIRGTSLFQGVRG
jgi:TolB-like protein/Tfp pilus assembly protein PilF/Flp pilus assembly protein TadD